MMWWGYLHKSGSILSKRYFDDSDMIEASKSSFVVDTYGPFKCQTKSDSLEILKTVFSKKHGQIVE